MSKLEVDETEEAPICRDPAFAKVLAHSVQMAEHIITEVGDDQEALENSHVTLGCDFVLDCFDMLIEYALRYEEDFRDVHEELLTQYAMMAKRKSGFGSKTVH